MQKFAFEIDPFWKNVQSGKYLDTKYVYLSIAGLPFKSRQGPSLRIWNNLTMRLMQQIIVTQVNGGSIVGINKQAFKMHLQIGDDLRTVHNDQLVYSNGQDIALTLLTRFKIWLVYNCQMEEDHLNIKSVTAALLLYNACTLLKMIEICVTNKNN